MAKNNKDNKKLRILLSKIVIMAGALIWCWWAFTTSHSSTERFSVLMISTVVVIGLLMVFEDSDNE